MDWDFFMLLEKILFERSRDSKDDVVTNYNDFVKNNNIIFSTYFFFFSFNNYYFTLAKFDLQKYNKFILILF